MQHLSSDTLLCLAGDFNCTFNPTLDRNSAAPHPASSRPLSNIISRHDINNIWRQQHPNLQQFSWCQVSLNHLSLARLDKFYIPNSATNPLTYTDIVPSGFSDHSLVKLCLSLPGFKHRTLYWCFNTSLLSDPFFKSSFKVYLGRGLGFNNISF